MNRAYNREIQKLLFPDSAKEWDGIIGPRSLAAIQALRDKGVRIGIASSFADPNDVRRFRRCKEAGGSDEECFRVGDNAKGCWEDDTSEGTGPSCAIPPDDMIELFGSVSKAKHRKLLVTGSNGRMATVVIKDRMPWKRNIVNGAIIDLNPDAVKALGWTPPIMNAVKWSVAPE